MSDVVVIGGGIVGAAVTRSLAEVGARVTLLEAVRFSGGTSTASFAWLNSNGKAPREYHDLNVAGMREHRAFADEFESANWLHGGGNVEWKGTEEEADRQTAKVKRMQEWGYAAEWITLDDLRELEPDLVVGPEDALQIAYYPEEAWVDPVRLSATLLRRAVEKGAVTRSKAKVVDMPVVGGRVTEVVTATGDRFPADLVVNCGGPAAGELATLAGSSLPMANAVGLLAFTEPAATTVQRIIHAPNVHIRPDGAGRLLLHDSVMDDSVTPDTEPHPGLQACQDVLAKARQLLPALAGTGVEAARVGTRPMPRDGLPAVGPLPGVDNVYAVVSHSAVTLALVFGRLVASEIVEGGEEPALTPFRPDRLVAGRAH